MKKALFAYLVATLMIISVACSAQNKSSSVTEDTLSQICVIGGKNYCAELQACGIRLDENLTCLEEHSISYEYASGEKATFSTEKQSYSLSYDYTITDASITGIRHIYKVDNSPDTEVGLAPDGSLVFITYPLIEPLDIKKTDTPETVQSVLEPAISDLVDFADYQSIECEDYNFNSDSQIGNYRFILSKEENGYLFNRAIIGVRNDGTIISVKILGGTIESENAKEICNSIDQEVEDSLLHATLKKIFDSDDTKLLNYNIADYTDYAKSLANYNDEIYISYTTVCTVYHSGQESELRFDPTILIPVRLLCAPEST